MKHVENRMFETAYRKLLYVASQYEPETRLSFKSEFWNAEKGYKYDYWEEARSAMKLDTWSAHKDDSQSIACHPTLWHVNAGYIKAPESCFRSELLEAD